MNAERVLQTMPVGVGRYKTCDYTTYWLCVPKMRKPVSTRIKRITAYQKAKKRRQFLKNAVAWCYAGIMLVGIVTMTITMLNMAGIIR